MGSKPRHVGIVGHSGSFCYISGTPWVECFLMSCLILHVEREVREGGKSMVTEGVWGVCNGGSSRDFIFEHGGLWQAISVTCT